MNEGQPEIVYMRALQNDDIAWIRTHVRTAVQASRPLKGYAMYLVEEAARNGSEHTLRHLLSFGIDVHASLQYATHYRYSSECVRLLLEAGARPCVAALRQAITNHTDHYTTWLLIQCGANPIVKMPRWMHLMHTHREEVRAAALHTIAASMRAGLGRDMARWLGRHVWALRCVMPIGMQAMIHRVRTAAVAEHYANREALVEHYVQ